MPVKLNKISKKLGYNVDQAGILRRYINEEGGWDSHLNNTKKFIEECAKKSGKQKVAVLGSGWLLDVPLEFLSSQFKHVRLYDICHPKQVQFKVKKFLNVELVEADLTGGIARQIYLGRKQIKEHGAGWLNNLKFPENISFDGYDLVISLNILNQIDVIIADYLKSKFSMKEKDLLKLREMLQKFHLQCLPVDKTCLISDVEEQQLDENNNLVKAIDLIYTDISLLNIKKKWMWHFDSNYTYNELYKTNLKVIAARK